MKTNNKWTKSDDTQFIRTKDNVIFELAQLDGPFPARGIPVAKTGDELWCVSHTTVNMAEWLDKEHREDLKTILNSYGYLNGVPDVKECYGEANMNQIMAECIFETKEAMGSEGCEWFVSHQEAEDRLQEVVKG